MTLALSGLVVLTNQLRTPNNQEASTGLDKWLLCTCSYTYRLNVLELSGSANITTLKSKNISFVLTKSADTIDSTSDVITTTK